MPISWNESRQNAIKFSCGWTGAKSERAEKQTFWNEFFQAGQSRSAHHAPPLIQLSKNPSISPRHVSEKRNRKKSSFRVSQKPPFPNLCHTRSVTATNMQRDRRMQHGAEAATAGGGAFTAAFHGNGRALPLRGNDLAASPGSNFTHAPSSPIHRISPLGPLGLNGPVSARNTPKLPNEPKRKSPNHNEINVFVPFAASPAPKRTQIAGGLRTSSQKLSQPPVDRHFGCGASRAVSLPLCVEFSKKCSAIGKIRQVFAAPLA